LPEVGTADFPDLLPTWIEYLKLGLCSPSDGKPTTHERGQNERRTIHDAEKKID
jgi:hypothetical protein